MTDGIGKIGGSNGGYNIPYFNLRKGEEEAAQVDKQPTQVERKEVSAERMMELLSAANSQFVQAKKEVKLVDLDAKTIDRIALSMDKFVKFVDAAEKELGSRDLAVELADIKSLM